jgi:hypothetical protein
MALLVPLYSFFILRRKLDVPNAAAVAATYGSISAVTFIAASSFLSQLKVPFGGHMVAAMALMESPAIVIGVALARRFGSAGDNACQRACSLRLGRVVGATRFLMARFSYWWEVCSLAPSQAKAATRPLHPFTSDIFKGMLCLFLLDMGLVSARQLDRLKQMGAFPIMFALLIPLVNAVIGITLARVLGMSEGDALMFSILSASASYIAVPAAMRLAVPEANPGLYVSMALALTFPFNIIVGMPLYMFVIQSIWR